MVRRLKDRTIQTQICNMSLLQVPVIFVKDIGTRRKMDCARLTRHGPFRLGNKMAWKKNADGILEYYYKKEKDKQRIIQKDWFKENGYKKETFPPQFFEIIEKTLKRGYWAYAIDGDGWIHEYSKKHSRNKFEVGIKLKDREPIQELADIYGASISRKDYKNENWESQYVMKMYGKRALHFLRLICPYMTEKRKKATQVINYFDPNYHPPKISMDFRKNSDLIGPHMESVGGFFDTEGSVGMKTATIKYKSKKSGDKYYYILRTWLHFTNTDLRPLRKIKKILETWPFNFNPRLYGSKSTSLNKDGKSCKKTYKLQIPPRDHLLFMKMFSPWILITRKREHADKFESQRQIYKLCDENK